MKSLGAILSLLFVCLQLNAQTINRAEYFFDSDPGIGNATALPVTPGTSINQTFSLSTASLSTGFHTLNTRVKSSDGVWSLFASRTFYIVPPPSAFVPSTQIRRAEFFFDTDPGVGLATPVTITPSANVTFPIAVPVSTLTPGFHNINVRVMDNQYRWSLFASRTFYIIPPPPNVTGPTSLVKAEYFIDSDPGISNGTNLPITSTNPQNNTFAIDLGNIAEGFHRLAIRYKDNQGKWSHFSLRTFYVIPGSTLSATVISEAEYFIDVDPRINPQAVGQPIAITPGATLNATYALDLTGIPSGDHILYVRVKDDLGFYSNVMQDDFTITSCIPPAMPLASDQTRCNTGTVTFTATGAQTGQTYRWYEDPFNTNILATTSSFTTPSLSANKTYYVSSYDANTQCESNRREIQAVITVLTKPVINTSGEISFCEGNAIFLSAPSGASQYLWSNGQATQQVLITTGGTYSVQTGNGTCLSESSDPVTVNVVPRPAKPTVTITGETTICGTGSVTLEAPDGFTYEWSNGELSRTISVTASGVYFVFVRNADNCFSEVSNPVVITFLTPPCGVVTQNSPPLIDAKPFASQIEGQVVVDLTSLITDPDNNMDFTSLSVPEGATSRGVPAMIDSDYRLMINYAGTPFSGTDRVTIQACDLVMACTQQVIDIDVVGDIVVYNGITPDGDGHNDFLLIKYIDAIEGASQNMVRVFNRWGDVVYEMKNYNNANRVFSGIHKNGKELPSGTYFYSIEFMSGKKPVTGYLTLLR